MSHIVLFEDKAYLIDFDRMHKEMFEAMCAPMPMTVPAPEPETFSTRMMRTFLDTGPVIRMQNAILASAIYDDPDPWEFAFLFPLGKKGYVKRR